MDFFDAQDHARNVSRRLVFLFALAVGGLVVGVYLIALVALGFAPVEGLGGGGLFQPELFLAVAVGMGLVIGGGSLFRTAQLRKGGAAVAELLGGRRVDSTTRDPAERVLLNVVEEMSIASGLPVPSVFVMDREGGINAFAAGHAPNDAAVAVTRGMLETLSRDELQGVVAHEFSHILNGDMRLNVRIMGLLFGILLLTVVGRGVLRGSMGGGRIRTSGGRRGGGGQIALVGVALVVLGYFGVLVGRLIQAAVSRQREFLADAAAVEFTRNPGGLAGALRRIGAASHGSRIQDHHAQEASHLFFAPGLKSAFSGLTATHPPLPERIRRIDPRWDGTFEVEPRRQPVASRDAGQAGAPRTPAVGTMGIPGWPPAMGAAGGEAPARAADLSSAFLATAGSLGPHHLAHARKLLEGVPDEVRESARTAEGALAVVLALLLEGDAKLREIQMARIDEALGPQAAGRVAEIHPQITGIGPEARLPLLELSLPALRGLPHERGKALASTVGALIRADGEILPFEFAVFHLVRRSLPLGKGDALPSRRFGTIPLARLRHETEVLLSAVARSASGDEAEIERAFRTGAALLPGDAAPWRLLPSESVSLDRVDEVLTRLEASAPSARRQILEAAGAAVMADAQVEVHEAEMLRALAEALEVPLPPLLPHSTSTS
jgi:Zn-dependent protease with chaperone function